MRNLWKWGRIINMTTDEVKKYGENNFNIKFKFKYDGHNIT